ncbi:YihY/virulence factor BrkB family protein [Dyella acidiphila]|uniref:YihY/virulence factor BrkB family protein n=1 Tax=Dyella acidiphila TaxID=2775866 RepID=A0ABR9GCN8_9GAMM|nr:YihY/virulence factor BrkB family protein [Dyella acidiphila]MBE1161817.1 YihY/virulence factor BrkB family protein [Dyella acidiphila]
MDRPFRPAFRFAIAGIGDDDLSTHAAAIAFYSALSMAPIVLLMLWGLSWLGPQWQPELAGALTGMMGSKAAATIVSVVNSAKSRPETGNIAGLIGIAVTLFSASAVFAQLQSTLNRIWHIQSAEHHMISHWLKARARAFGLLVGIAFLMIVSFAASAVIHLLIPRAVAAWASAEYVVSLAIFATAFAAMYRVLPDTHIAWSDAGWGGLLTTLLFILGKFGIELYIQHASIGGAYGSAGGLVVMLTWVYYASFVVLLGAELTHGLAQARNRSPN